MMKRPKRGETEEDILRMQQEFLKEKAKNPKMQPSAQIVKIEKPPRKSLFAKSREKAQDSIAEAPLPPAAIKQAFGEVYEKSVAGADANLVDCSRPDIVLGDIVEKQFSAPKLHTTENTALEASAFPKVEKMPLLPAQPGKSIFALSMAAKGKGAIAVGAVSKEAERKRLHQSEPMECEPIEKRNLSEIYGGSSTIVEDVATAGDVHKENLELLSKMKEEEILAERRKLLESIDPSLVALLAKRRQEKAAALKTEIAKAEKSRSSDLVNVTQSMETDNEGATTTPSLPASNAAVEILERSSAEKWIHFDVVEKDKLEWMREIPTQAAKLKPGEKFEARFDWKGVLLPYSTTSTTTETLKAVGDPEEEVAEKDERELYLHGDEPQRAGYTLQELFRLARSNIMQQRVSAFGAIAGILNIYNQGFYDQVLELPISKIFFLIRFGLDDNTPAMLEVLTKALAFLFYNETDEALLDFIYENPGCHWQPTLQVLSTDGSDGDSDPTSIENVQKQMKQLQMNATARGVSSSISANIEESEEESKTSMTDFQLAETDLIDCLLRTNILQRIYFILNNVRPDNSTVSSCLKLLIRLGRTSVNVATQIANHGDLIKCLCDNFLPGFERVDTTLQTPPFYNYPQYLCLKLVRILISQNLRIALKLVHHQNLIEKLQNYLFNREDIKGKLIKIQIESLRILRCLLLLGVDNTLYKKFLPAFRYMLEWHYNHVIYEEGGPYLIRQHAAALLAAITSAGCGLEVHSLLGDILHDSCCNWFHKATRNGVKEFSQATLLSACLDAVTWYTLNTNDAQRFRKFSEKYLCEFVASDGFEQFVNSLAASSVILSLSTDRRNVHPPLPNVGAIIHHKYGPQLLLPQTYAVPLLNALWRLLQLQLTHNQKALFNAMLKPQIVEPLVQYLRAFASPNANCALATNFYAKTEIKFIFKLLCFEGFSGAYFAPAEMLQMVYKFLCCLTAEHIPEIEQLFERVIFNKAFIEVDEKTLTKWRNTCLELVYPHYIVVSPTELTLSIPHTQAPILPIDWPYFQLKIILQNYIENVQQKPTGLFSEREVLHMTLNFVAQLEQRNPQLQMVTPTEKLMYLMIAFMGPDSQFLEADMRQLLRQHVLRFYEQCSEHTFQFDAIYEGKCKFENLYALFVDHFQAASYGDELFGSLLLLPLAQKYDNKWRRRVWSDYASALRFLDCDESLLLGGLQAYLEPAEQEESLLHLYAVALNTNLVRPNTIPHKIAKYHVEKFKENRKK